MTKTKLSALEEDILTVLSHGTDYGYSILKQLNKAYHPNQIQQGILYPILHRMKAKGLVTQKWTIMLIVSKSNRLCNEAF